VDGESVAGLEQGLCRKADVVFTTSRSLLERKRPFNPETHLASHGVDHAHFAKALDEATPPAPDIATLPRPVIGFFGWIERWIDLDLLAWVAERRPEWSIVLVGKATVDVSGLGRYPNIHVLGRRPYAELPGYCKAFDVAVCPFVLNELTRNVNPIKLREYLSAGVPTVSTAIPEAAAYSPACRVAADREGFLAACEAALAEGSGEQRRRRSDAMRAETWEGKAEEIGRIVQGVKARKRRESEHALGGRTLGAGVWP
jgi:glycosyltransferase involved in cell wall biosynthesis